MADGRFALLVANARYTDATLAQLEAPAHDADSLANVLGDPEIGAFTVKSVVDEPAVNAMQEIEAFFDGRHREDLLLLYFSGHGILDQSSRLYFATTDTRVDRPRSTAIPAAFVNDLMSECRSRRQVLILDCCNSGSFARGAKAGGNIGTRERFQGRGRVVITASDALQYAFETDSVEGGGISSVFTEMLVSGLETGEADLDGDGYVSLDELYDYVYGHVVDTSPRQRPGKWAFGVEGRIFVARSAAPTAPVGPALRELPAALSADASPTSPPSLRLGRRRRAYAAIAVVAAAAIAATTTILLTGGGTPSASLTPERQAARAVFDAWRASRLASLTGAQISSNARRFLTQMPVRPVLPDAPQSCYGESGNASCPAGYPGLGFDLEFDVLRYGGGLQVSDVICRSNQNDKPIPGGAAACARRVRSS